MSINKLEQILESDPKLSSFGKELKEKSKKIKKQIENNQKAVEATQSIKDSIDKQKEHSKSTIEMIKKNKENK